jgi:YVTN family beta-propeller protein
VPSTSFGDEVSVIDVASRTVKETIQVGHDPWGIAITPDGTRALVANAQYGLTFVDIRSRATWTMPVEAGRSVVAIAPNGSVALVANSNEGTVSLI